MFRSLEELKFDNTFVRSLPPDTHPDNTRRRVLGACYSHVTPESTPQPQLIAYSTEMADQLGLSIDGAGLKALAEVFSGNRQLPGMSTYAACYGGHQFGNWAGQLGDGRAITLGEVLNGQGERWELQLKGAGPTPYSRMGDGYAVMRSSVREFLCSEAMFHLGVPTTRALSLVSTGRNVVRDMFYDGNPRPEPGAVVCRVAPSFLRFGNFEILAAQENTDVLRKLADYAIATHFPHLGVPGPETYLQWFEEICERTAKMVVHWMRVGFVHGVMNTDNMSILGLTIDYGPYGWLENYDPVWTPNTTDAHGRRYAYGNQPQIAGWNLVRLASALVPLLGRVDEFESALQVYGKTLVSEQRQMMARKLGIGDWREEDEALVNDLHDVLQLVETDMTIFYRRLADMPFNVEATDDQRMAPLMTAYYAPDNLEGETRRSILEWLSRYAERVRSEPSSAVERDGQIGGIRRAKMNSVNPKFVLRNYLAQLAIDEAEKGDGTKVDELLEVMRHPYDEQLGNEAYAEKRPEWARNRPGCSMLSCSS